MSKQRGQNQSQQGGASRGIAWTEQTWNPIRGCSKVSAGCTNCYAEAMAARFCGPGQPYEGVSDGKRWTGEVRFLPEKLAEPLRWTKPRLVFVNSMSDLFHEALSFEQIAAIWGVMAASPTHTFQVLTKRPARALEWFQWLKQQKILGSFGDRAILQWLWANAYEASDVLPTVGQQWPLPNVWLGVSAEDQAAADERIPLLLQCPAAVRWVSAEPLLGPVNLREISDGSWYDREGATRYDALRGSAWWGSSGDHGLGGGPALDWVVVGGESGPKARACDGEWIRGIVADCREAGVPVFVKQLGAAYSDPENGLAGHGVETMDGEVEGLFRVRRLKHHKGGDVGEWPEDLRVRQWPQTGGAT